MKKVVLVFGGTRGIGKEIALTLLKNEYNVIVTYINSIELAKELENIGIHTFKVDNSDVNAIKDFYNKVISEYGSIDVVINNAAYSYGQKLIIDTTDDEIIKTINTNLVGTIVSTRCAIDTMLNRGGNIINISSIWGERPASCESVYGASKAAINEFTISLAEEYSNSNISLSIISPTFVITDMNSHLSKEEIDEFLKDQNLQKVVEKTEIAEKVMEILSLPSKETNGKKYLI